VKKWLLPWVPSLAIFLVCFSASSLESAAIVFSAALFCAILVLYVFVSMPMSYIKHFKLDQNTEDDMTVVEIVYQNGKWQAIEDMRLAASSQAGDHSSGVEFAALALLKPRSNWESETMAVLGSQQSKALSQGMVSFHLGPGGAASVGNYEGGDPAGSGTSASSLGNGQQQLRNPNASSS